MVSADKAVDSAVGMVGAAGEAIIAFPARRAGLARRGPVLASLRQRIARIEGVHLARQARAQAPLCLGVAEVDAALPGGGLRRAGLHEVLAGDEAAALAFIAALTARGIGERGAALWCAGGRGLYAPGLAQFGLDPDRLILARGADDTAILWAMEEGLRSARLPVVVGAVRRLDLTAGRRLQLAAERGGAVALALRPDRAASRAGAGLTRWRLAGAPGGPVAGYRGVGAPRFSIELLRCRGGDAPRRWLIEWDDATHTFRLAAPLADRAVLPRPAEARA